MELTKLQTVINPLTLKAGAKLKFAGAENTGFWVCLTTENIPPR